MNYAERSKSFKPIVENNTRVLILGSLPGKTSIEIKQYYGHPRNRLWKILAKLKNCDIPKNYKQKKYMLVKYNIGLWDVVNNAERIGSLDKNIKFEIPNQIDSLLDKYRNIKVIGFNGKKSEKLFFKYFSKRSGIRYVPLPSTSPANMAINFADICRKWSELF